MGLLKLYFGIKLQQRTMNSFLEEIQIYWISNNRNKLYLKLLIFQRQSTLKKTMIVNFKKNYYTYQNIGTVILQYCICKICSALEIGIPLQNIFGFDLICYQNCIQFFMEKGIPLIDLKNTINFQNYSQSLIRSIQLMHNLHIVHNDLKIQNTVYSKKLKKVVFIDFGLSQLVKQKIGFKTKTLFKGSYEYVSHEMKLLIGKKTGYIDLYWNDLCCLQKLFVNLKIEYSNVVANQSESYSLYQKYLKNPQQIRVCEYLANYNQFRQSKFYRKKRTLKTLKQGFLHIQINTFQKNYLTAQLYYLIYNKNIKAFWQCISPKNQINESEKMYFLNQVMYLLEQVNGEAMCDEIYIKNYQTYRINLQTQEEYQFNRQKNKHLRFFKFLKEKQILESRYFDLSLVFQEVYEKPIKQWLVIFQQLKQIGKNHIPKSCKDQNQMDCSYLLQNQNVLDQNGKKIICKIFILTISVIFRNRNESVSISHCVVSLFKKHFIKFIQKNCGSDQKYSFQQINQILDKLPNIKDVSKYLLQQEIYKFSQPEQIEKKAYNILNNINKQQDQQDLSNKKSSLDFFNHYLRFMQYVLSYQGLQNSIESLRDQINFFKPERSYEILSTLNAKQKLKIAFFMCYCQFQYLNCASQLLQQIKKQFNQKYADQAQLLSGMIFLKQFFIRMSYHEMYCKIYHLKQVKNKISRKQQIRKKSIDPKQDLYILKGNKSVFYFQQNYELVDFWFQVFILKNQVYKGVADFNALRLKQQIGKLIDRVIFLFPNQIQAQQKKYFYGQLYMCKAFICDYMRLYQESLHISKQLSLYWSGNLQKNNNLGYQILMQAYFHLGFNQHKIYELNELSNLTSYEQFMSQRKQDIVPCLEVNQINYFFDKKQFENKLQIHQDCLSIMLTLTKMKQFSHQFCGNEKFKIITVLQMIKKVNSLKQYKIYQQTFQKLTEWIEKQVVLAYKFSFYSQLLLIMTEVMNSLIQIDVRRIGQYFEKFWTIYKFQVERQFHADQQSYPVVYFIAEQIVVGFQANIQVPIKQQNSIKLLLQYSDRYDSYIYLVYLIKQVQKITLEQKQFRECQQIDKINLAQKIARIVIQSKRCYLFFMKGQVTIWCLLAFVSPPYNNLFFSIIYEICLILKRYKGKSKIRQFNILSRCFQVAQINSKTIYNLSMSFLDSNKFQKFHTQMPQVIPFVITFVNMLIRNLQNICVDLNHLYKILKKIALAISNHSHNSKQHFYFLYIRTLKKVIQLKNKIHIQQKSKSQLKLRRLQISRMRSAKSDIEIQGQSNLRQWITYFQLKYLTSNLNHITLRKTKNLLHNNINQLYKNTYSNI